MEGQASLPKRQKSLTYVALAIAFRSRDNTSRERKAIAVCLQDATAFQHLCWYGYLFRLNLPLFHRNGPLEEGRVGDLATAL